MENNRELITEQNPLENIFATAITLPGVKVDRRLFLCETFARKDVDIQRILDVGPVEAGCSREMLKEIASSLVFSRTSQSSLVSFVAGIPGGLAVALGISADTLQFFAMTLRMAQELIYLYGEKDLWVNGQVDDEAVRNELIMYIGVMFGVTGAAAGVRLFTTQIAKTTLKKLPQQALTKTVWYPILKQVGKAIGVKITKTSFAKGLSDIIPVIGGIISGGLNFASMKPMGDRLAQTLDKAYFDYTEADVMADYREVVSLSKQEESSVKEEFVSENQNISNGQKQFGDGISGPCYYQAEPVKKPEPEKKAEPPKESQKTELDPFETLTKLAKLKDLGIITEEEFAAKKKAILDSI